MCSATNSECSGLVRTVGQCAKTWWSWRCIVNESARYLCLVLESGLFSRPPRLEHSKRLSGLSTLSYLFNNPVASTFERSENITIVHT